MWLSNLSIHVPYARQTMRYYITHPGYFGIMSSPHSTMVKWIELDMGAFKYRKLVWFTTQIHRIYQNMICSFNSPSNRFSKWLSQLGCPIEMVIWFKSYPNHPNLNPILGKYHQAIKHCAGKISLVPWFHGSHETSMASRGCEKIASHTSMISGCQSQIPLVSTSMND